MRRKKSNNKAPKVYTKRSLTELNGLLSHAYSMNIDEIHAGLKSYQLTRVDGTRQALCPYGDVHICSRSWERLDLRRFNAESSPRFLQLRINADFRKANLYKVQFEDCTVQCDFRGAYLRGAKFRGCTFWDTTFQGAYLWRSRWIGSASSREGPWEGHNRHSILASAMVLSQCNLREAYFYDFAMSYCGLAHSDVSYAFFDRCDWSGVSLKQLVTCTGWETVVGLPHGMYADLVAMGYKPKED